MVRCIKKLILVAINDGITIYKHENSIEKFEACTDRENSLEP